MTLNKDKNLRKGAFKVLLFEKHNEATYVLHLFFLVSLAGWIGETVFFVIIGAPADRGFLTMPFCPVYGFSVCGIYLLTGPPYGKFREIIYDKLIVKRRLSELGAVICTVVPHYITVTFCVTLSELSGGLFFDKLLNIRLWDYSGFCCNFMGYVCPQFSFLFGLAASISTVIADKAIKLMKKFFCFGAVKAVDVTFSVLMIADFTFNVIAVIVTGGHIMLYGTHV